MNAVAVTATPLRGGGTTLDKTCDEGHIDAYDQDVHACDSNFWVWMFVMLTLIGGGAAGVYLTKRKKALMAEQEMEDKATLDTFNKRGVSDDVDE